MGIIQSFSSSVRLEQRRALYATIPKVETWLAGLPFFTPLVATVGK